MYILALVYLLCFKCFPAWEWRFKYLYFTTQVISVRVIDTDSFKVKTLRPHPCFCVVIFLSVVDHKEERPTQTWLWKCEVCGKNGGRL